MHKWGFRGCEHPPPLFLPLPLIRLSVISPLFSKLWRSLDFTNGGITNEFSPFAADGRHAMSGLGKRAHRISKSCHSPSFCPLTSDAGGKGSCFVLFGWGITLIPDLSSAPLTLGHFFLLCLSINFLYTKVRK